MTDVAVQCIGQLPLEMVDEVDDLLRSINIYHFAVKEFGIDASQWEVTIDWTTGTVWTVSTNAAEGGWEYAGRLEKDEITAYATARQKSAGTAWLASIGESLAVRKELRRIMARFGLDNRKVIKILPATGAVWVKDYGEQLRETTIQEREEEHE